MHVDCIEKSQYTLARVTGSIELRSGEQLALAPCLKLPLNPVVLDLAGVDFIDSSGVRVLLEIIREFKAADKKIALANPSPFVHKTLQLVSFDHLVPITDSVESAVDALVG